MQEGQTAFRVIRVSLQAVVGLAPAPHGESVNIYWHLKRNHQQVAKNCIKYK